jgi:mannonate dehydratase
VANYPALKFTETFHDEGQIDMYAAMQAYYEIGFKGTIRPDHVPTMHGEENTRPGYMTLGTLYAIGYMRGLANQWLKLAPNLKNTYFYSFSLALN